MKRPLKYITTTVWVLSLISLFTDIASEMLYPIMPIYLRAIGFSAFLIGLLEGIAEFVSGFSKGYFGNLSDRLGKRVPFVRIGYSLSAISKPMMAIFTFPIWIFLARTLDRLGKGIRTSARDAILSLEATPDIKGRVFGLHRGMDTLGATIGPGLSLLMLFLLGGNDISNLKLLFLFAFIPGVLSVFLTFLIKDRPGLEKPSVSDAGFFSFLSYWKIASKSYKRLVVGLLIFALINSSDIFLLLMVKNAGASDMWVIFSYMFYNFVYALLSLPIGMFADKIGLKNMLIIGIAVFAIVYFMFALTPTIFIVIIAFLLYAFYAAATESVSKALISNLVEKKDIATAMGFFNSFNSIMTMFSSIIAGFLWSTFFPALPFFVSAIIAFCVAFYLKLAIK
ncbi:MAG: MFS transporter [Ignavibacteria bacterium]